MRRLLVLALLLLVAVAIYAVYPRDKQGPQEGPVRAVANHEPPLEPGPPHLAVPRENSDAHANARVLPADEPTLMQTIRDNVRSNPSLAEALAREGRQRYDDGSDSDERDALLVEALINQQHIGAARSETYYYLDHHHNGRFVDHLMAMTGVHPPPRRPAPP